MAAIGGDLSSPFRGIKSRSRYELENLSIAVIDGHFHCFHGASIAPRRQTAALHRFPVLRPLSDLAALDFLPRQQQRYRADHVSLDSSRISV